jgi:gliding motility-associated-like protein
MCGGNFFCRVQKRATGWLYSSCDGKILNFRLIIIVLLKLLPMKVSASFSVLLLLLVLMTPAKSQINLSQGLVAYYPFNGNANDASGNNHNGVFQNGTQLGVDRFGVANAACLLDGVDDYVRVTDNGAFSNATFSVSVWFQTNSSALQNVVGKRDFVTPNGTGGAQYQFSINYAPFPGFVSNLIGNNSTCTNILSSSYINSGGLLCNDRWYHAVATFDGASHKLYLDGVLVRNELTTFSAMLTGCNSELRFGNWWALDVLPFKGKLDDIRWYNRALNQSEVNALWNGYTFSCAASSCSNWLSTPSQGAIATIGDLDVNGNQLTVEANFNRTAPLNSGLYYGHLISKHSGATNVNYALLPNGCELTTTNGYFSTFQSCPPILNKTYHVAMVYDGVNLKFYRNGFLLSSQPCTGNIVTNDLLTTIAQVSSSGNPFNNQFIGYVNEVRIWNAARTQSQIQTYMNSSLPNPTTQAGLLGYYTFDNLLNKQGNPAFNGILNGGAVINSVNPDCNFLADSCAAIVTNQDTIINNYTPVLGFLPCENKITVEDAGRFNPGDTVLLIQMKGAVIDSADAAGFGNITDYKSAGNYEFNYVKSKTGNIIELQNLITRTYEVPAGKVQLVRVPYYQNISFAAILTCLPWDGSKGGVLVFNVKDTVTLTEDVDVTGKGFNGGVGVNTGLLVTNCANNGYNYSLGSTLAARKGESIANTGPGISCGKGAPAAGGGGGLDHNSGGGGGGNGGVGGFGGYQLEPCGNAPFDNRGIGGRSLTYNNTTNKIFLGSGGGAGHANNPGNVPPAGGNGGGIVIINAGVLRANAGKKIKADGAAAVLCTAGTSPDCHDGMGGGGAAGTVLLNVTLFAGSVNIDTKGGKGADMSGSVPLAGRIGAGGGGGGGMLWVRGGAVPGNVVHAATGGPRGVLLTDNNNSWGTTDGAAGISLANLQVPFDTVPFVKNIDSVRIKDTITACRNYQFTALAFTKRNGITNWQWNFGDGSVPASGTMVTHQYAPGAATYTVTLTGRDVNGCVDSVKRNIFIEALSANAVPDTLVCTSPAAVTLRGGGGVHYLWSPAALLSSSTLQNPTASVIGTTKFYLRVYNSDRSCVETDSATVTVADINVLKSPVGGTMCVFDTIALNGNNGPLFIYQWSPAIGLSNANSENPLCFVNTTTPYTVTVSQPFCNVQRNFNVLVNVNSLPYVQANRVNDLDCYVTSTLLNATGAQQYLWSPQQGLTGIFSNSPVAKPGISSGSIWYTVRGVDANGCVNYDSVEVKFNAGGKSFTEMPNSFTPNGDGINDCFGPGKFWRNIVSIEFMVYNRWGERVFYSTNIVGCWDGNYKGANAEPGAYVYYLKVKTSCGDVEKKGNVILIR